jgi:tetratricopeptide (TPR) repeat protein
MQTGMTTSHSKLAWVGPIAAGIALLGGAFLVASYIASPSSKADPFKGVVTGLEDQVRTNPGSADLRVAIGDAYMKDNRPKEALAQYQEALTIDGSREDALYGTGLAFRDLGDLTSAGSALQTVIESNKSNPSAALNKRLQGAHFYLGLVLRDQGRYDDAINELRAALGLNRSDADTLFELGKTFALNGNSDDASAALETALAFVPDYRDAYTELEKLSVTTGDQARATYAGAMLEVLDGKARDAVPKLQTVAEQGQSAHYWWALGYAQEKSGDKDGAIAAYQKAVAINPGELLAAESLRQLQGGG